MVRIPSRIVESAAPSALSPGQVEREVHRNLDDGAKLLPAGTAKRRPRRLFSLGYTPKYRISLFDTLYYLTNVRQNVDIRFFVAYVVPDVSASRDLYPRIFYKDLSLVWRSASHFVRTADENWIGKGDVATAVVDGYEETCSVESTTDLPLEIQTALETLSRRARRIPHDDDAVGLVLRRGTENRIRPYADFTGPRRRAYADPRNRIHGGRPIARFLRPGDPGSLRFARGYEPDFRAPAILEVSETSSRLYGGRVRRFRILSRNRRVQFLFLAGPRHVWIGAPQATTTELSSYGLRTVDVLADEDLSIPGFEYHSTGDVLDETGGVSQIPVGYAGAPSEIDPTRSDASPWLDALPVVREFRRKVLRRRPR